MFQLSYLRLYLGMETVSRRLLQQTDAHGSKSEKASLRCW